MESSNSIKINQSGLYEITVCGRISGVTKDIGGAFYLIKSETSEVLTDMSFILSKGNTEDMDFSEISFVDITAPATLQIKTEIDGDTVTSNIPLRGFRDLKEDGTYYASDSAYTAYIYKIKFNKDTYIENIIMNYDKSNNKCIINDENKTMDDCDKYMLKQDEKTNINFENYDQIDNAS